MLNISEHYFLSHETIDIISGRVCEICKSANVSSKDALQIRLGIEDCLLSYLDKYGSQQEIVLSSSDNPFRRGITIKCRSSEVFNPSSAEEDSSSYINQSILSYLKIVPEYSYSSGWNCLYFRLKRPERSPIVSLLRVIAASLVIGILGKLVIPESTLSVINQNFISPTYDKFLGILSCIAGPLLFFSVSWGIYGMGDTATLNRLGKSIIKTMLCASLISAVCCVPAIFIFGCNLLSGGTDFSQISAIYSMLLDIIPRNIVEPFYNGNILQIIVLAVIVGICLLYLQARTKALATAIGQLNSLVSFLMELIGRLVPFFIALVMINLIWSDDILVMANSWRYVLVLLVALVLDIVFFTLITAAKQHVSPITLAKKAFPAFVVALTTASSAASFHTMTKACEDGFGISRTMTSFGIPLGIILQKTANTINYMLIIFYISSIYSLSLSLSSILMMIFICAITSVATPPVPGGAAIAYTALFSQVGLPLEALTLVFAIDMITDFFITSTEIYCIQMAMINIASRFDLIDKRKLAAEC